MTVEEVGRWNANMSDALKPASSASPYEATPQLHSFSGAGADAPVSAHAEPEALAPPSNGNPCRNGTFSSLPFCDPAKHVEDRVRDLLQRLSLSDKITQLTTGNGVNGGTLG